MPSLFAEVRTSSGVFSGFNLCQLRVHGDHDDVGLYGAALCRGHPQQCADRALVDLLRRHAHHPVPIRSGVVAGHGLLLRSQRVRSSP